MGECLLTLREVDYTVLPQAVDAVFDEPVPELFINFFLSFPRAKVIITKRPSEEWASKRLARKHAFVPMQEPCGLIDPPLHLEQQLFSQAEWAQLFNLNNNFV